MEKALGMFVTLIVALAMTGVGVAHWSDNVQIEGTIHMGELIVGVLDNSVVVTETINGGPENAFPPEKDVCDATVTLSDWQTSVHHVPPQTVAHTMTIDIENAYPQWDLHISFVLKNAGTIPATYTRLLELTGYDNTDNEDLVWREDNWYYIMPVMSTTLNNFVGGAWVWEGALCNPPGTENTEIMNVVAIAYVPRDGQLHPCTEYPVYIDLDFKQTAEECHTYTFSAMFEFVQWNKAEEVCEEY